MLKNNQMSNSCYRMFVKILSSFRSMFSQQNVLVGILAFLLILFTSITFSERAESLTGSLLGLSGKNEILTFIGIGMGGILVALQALMSYKRAKAMENVAKAQTESNKNTEQGQRQERLKNAIEHLGHKSESVRLGGAYELFHLAKETESLRQTALDIFCAHIRRVTSEGKYQELYKEKPSVEIQSLLTLLFVKEYDIFAGFHADLQRCWLNGANLSDAHMENATLRYTQLQGSDLFDACLREVDLCNANLRQAYLVGAEMQEVFLIEARLQNANLGRVKMQGANLIYAQLQGANLAWVQLQGSLLLNAQLQEANFYETQFQGANCNELIELPRIFHCVDQKSDLSHVIFSGGLTSEDIDSIFEGLCDDSAEALKAKLLLKHVDRPASNQPPEDVFTGTYSTKDVENWDIEYGTNFASFID